MGSKEKHTQDDWHTDHDDHISKDDIIDVKPSKTRRSALANVKFRPRKKRKLSQAERLIEKFGSQKVLCDALNEVGYKITTSAVSRWTTDSEKGGSDGLVPSRAWPSIFRAARLMGILIQPSDLDPRAH